MAEGLRLSTTSHGALSGTIPVSGGKVKFSTLLVKIRKLFQAHTAMAIELLHEVPTYIKPRYVS